MNKYITKVVNTIIVLLLSWSLTTVVTEYTTVSSLQYVFIYLYFTLIFGIWNYFTMKIQGFFDIKLVFCVVGITLLVLATQMDKFLKSEISIQTKQSTEQFKEEEEVWLSNIYVNEEDISLKEFALSDGWYYQDEWDDVISNSAEPNILTLRLPKADSIILRFAYYNKFKDNTKIISGNREIDNISLKKDGDGYYYQLPKRLKQIFDIKKIIQMAIIIFFLLYFSIKIALKKKGWLSITTAITTAIILCQTCLPLKVETNILVFAAAVAELVWGKCEKEISNYCLKDKIISIVIAGYSATVSFGRPLFLSGSYMHISVQSLMLFIVTIVWWCILILNIFRLLETVCSLENREYKKDWKEHIILFMIFCAVWELVLISFCPGNLTSDSANIWKEALGGKISTHHSVLYTLLIRGLIAIIPSTMWVLTVQVIASAWIMSSVLILLKRKIKRVRTLIILTFFIALIPSNYMLITTLWKDIPFSLALMVLTICLFKLGTNANEFFRKWYNYVALIVSLFCVNEFRHNGVLVFGSVVLFLVVAVFKDKKNAYKYLTIVLFSIASIGVFHGPIYRVLDVQVSARTSKPFITMFAALGSVVHKGGTLSKETTNILYKIMPYEQWCEYYDPFDIDSYRWNPEIKSNMDVSWIDTKTAFSCYLDGLVRYPDIVIKDRLDGSDLVWDMTQPKESFNSRYAMGVWLPDYISPKLFGVEYSDKDSMAYIPDYATTKLWVGLAELASSNEVTDSIFYRSGVYLILLLILLAFNYFRGNKAILVAAIPILSNTVSLMLLLAHQSYRYVWYIPICTGVLFVLTVVSSDKNCKIGEMPILCK